MRIFPRLSNNIFLFVCFVMLSSSAWSQVTINSEDFETGWGIWTGGINTDRTNSGTPNGTYSIKIEDKTNPGSSIYTNNLDLTSYETIYLSFEYQTDGFKSGQEIIVEFSDDEGITWSTEAVYVEGTDFNDGNTFSTTITINDIDGTLFTNTSQLKIRGNSGNNIYAYIDNVNIDGDLIPPRPEINLIGKGITIIHNDLTPSTTDDTDYGTGESGVPIDHIFTIENNGVLDLNLLGVPIVDISGSTAFSILSQPSTTSIAPGSSLSFTVRFLPTFNGTVTADISILSDDYSHDENPYIFRVQGTSIVPPPEYTIYYENFDEDDGSWVASTGSTTNFVRGTGLSSVSENAEGSYWFTSTYKYYSDGAYTTLTSPILSTIGYYNLVFSADIRYNLEADPDDGMILEFRKNNSGVWSSWTVLGSNGEGQNWYDGTSVDAISPGSDGWTNNSSTSSDFSNYFVTAKIELPSDLYDSSEIQFRFVFASDSDTVVDDGAAIDNIIIYGDPLIPFTDPTFAPGGINSNLKLWLKATSEIGSTSDGSEIIIWEDSAFDNNAIATTSNSPSFQDNITNNINFNPVLTFDRSNPEYMRGKGGFYSHDYFVVIKPNGIIDYTENNRMMTIAGRVSQDSYAVDGSGLGLGNISARFNNEVIAHMSSSVPTSPTPSSEQQYGRAFVSTTKSYTDKVMIFNVKTNSTGTQTEIYLNGIKIDNITAQAYSASTNSFTGVLNFSEFLNQQFYVGAGRFSLNGHTVQAYADGSISEIISYSDTNNTTNQQIILSYLALKNGVTLHAPNSITTDDLNDIDYLDSAGNVIWDTSLESGTFNYDIAGIGRDDASELLQKQSKTVNTTDDITIGLGEIYSTNSANTNTFGTDKEFLVWGNDNGTLAAQPEVVVDMSEGIAGLETLVSFIVVGRTWKVCESVPSSGGDIGLVTVSIPEAMLTATLNPPGSYLMFISDSDIFDSTADYRVMSPDGLGNLEAEYDFDGVKYITFGYAPQIEVERSIYFDGVQDYIDVGNYKDLNNAFTVSSWIKRGSSSLNKTILSKRDAAYSGGYDLKLNNIGKIEMSWINGSKQTITSNTTIPEDEWHHVAVIYNGGIASIYIDGVLDNSVSGMLDPVDTTHSFIIAAAGKTSTTDFYEGNIDEVRLWDVALTEDQLHYIMNQEIVENSANVDGIVLPTALTHNEVISMPWSHLTGYYPMSIYTYTNTNDHSINENQGSLRNLDTVDFQTAPLPYETNNNGDWDTNSTWLNGDLQTIPGSSSIVDPNTTVDWNIVQVNHDITMDNASLPTVNNGNRTLLGLQSSDTTTLTVATDGGLTVSHYLELNGTIDLEGDSQLIQTSKSDLVTDEDGKILRRQEGTSNYYHYNDWGSPVGNIGVASELNDDNSSSNNINNSSFTLENLKFDDGNNVVFTSKYQEVGKISTRWMYLYQNGVTYWDWINISPTTPIQPGVGYTHKGTGTTATEQQYIFEGKPNNGTILLEAKDEGGLESTFYIAANPYPSALDINAFIDDNQGVISGELYLWQHWGGNSHILNEYEAGYAIVNKWAGVRASQFIGIEGDNTGGQEGSLIPTGYLPVSQGFTVEIVADGNIEFNNSQRVFIKEADALDDDYNLGSVFFTTKKSSEQYKGTIENAIGKIRLNFKITDGPTRELVLGFSNFTSDEYDYGYDVLNSDPMNEDDLNLIFNDERMIIQAYSKIKPKKVVPLIFKSSGNYIYQIEISELVNIHKNQDIYLKDNLKGVYHNLRSDKPYKFTSESGTFTDRFEIVFQKKGKKTSEELLDDSVLIYVNNNASLLFIKELESSVLELNVYNIMGQSILSLKNLSEQSLESGIDVSGINTGFYIVKVEQANGKISSRKVLIE